MGRSQVHRDIGQRNSLRVDLERLLFTSTSVGSCQLIKGTVNLLGFPYYVNVLFDRSLFVFNYCFVFSVRESQTRNRTRRGIYTSHVFNPSL